MIKLHFAPLTRSIRVRWLLEELGVPYELVTTEYNRDGNRGFAQNTPSGNYPYIEDGDIALSESGAIVQYILERYGNGKLEPLIGSKDRAAYLYWLHFAEGTAANSINMTVRSEEHTSELQSLMRISYAVFRLKKNTHNHS